MKKCQGCGKETKIRGLGSVLLCQAECFPDASIDREEAQSKGESFDVTLWAKRRYKRLHDNTVGKRVNSRNEKLNERARSLGYEGFSEILTMWLRKEIDIPPNPRGK